MNLQLSVAHKEAEIAEMSIKDDDLTTLSWQDMESLVGRLFEAKSYKVTVTKPTGDFGIDVEAWNDTEYIGIQVKRWKADVGFEDCAKTLGVSHKYNRAIIISTLSDFTSQAWKFQGENSYRLELWNTYRFRQELESFNITPSSIRHHPSIVGDEKTNFVHSSSVENNQKTNQQKTAKYGLGLTFLGLFLLIMAGSTTAVFWSGLILFIIGIILLIVSLFWKVAEWASDKIESNTTSTYILSKDENKQRKEKNELVKYLLIILMILIMLGIQPLLS